ncbi:MAG: NusA-like transcription termination signal-binding factor [Natronomonas sp.]|jgi:N utilization substance protein A|uniref:Probable transcription termination protein NusA n=1 Tax=Natronomonas salsuginis TaxID=2217661 RepID=A0A4U5JAJ7_9EURY|nr:MULTISPECIES: NusA-like transcription termination signal-binding factor [Natronomonas]MDR9380353.1 NusA-like transcription termination signal-binding factor [Natronomonas sp.]MDR9431839.1 NusA-like transcription termination signal-binding factor [Natronomonas sp.]TKR25824.1 NusA-like transcription termination signal-binding factor [Natronomonas salsuginis]
MIVTLSDEARQYIALFDDETDVPAIDCVVDDEYDRLAFVVPAGTMGQAIGPGGKHVRTVESALGRTVIVVENADRAADFVANALAPAAVYNVTISENDTTIAYAEVDHDDRGVAIGKDGRRIDLARRLAKRHFDIDGIELT